MTEQDWIARIGWPEETEGHIELVGDGRTWRAVGAEDDQYLALSLKHARLVTADYQYSPADGWPGRRLAEMVATEMKGQLELAPMPATDPNVVY